MPGIMHNCGNTSKCPSRLAHHVSYWFVAGDIVAAPPLSLTTGATAAPAPRAVGRHSQWTWQHYPAILLDDIHNSGYASKCLKSESTRSSCRLGYRCRNPPLLHHERNGNVRPSR